MFKLVNKTNYELMKKMLERQDNYIEQIKLLNSKVNDLNYDNELLKDAILDNNRRIKVLNGKIGGLKASNNYKTKHNKELIEGIKNLESKLLKAEKQLSFYKKHRKNKGVEKK